MLLLPILLPILGGIFVFRAREEEARNRLALWTVLATAALVLLLCFFPAKDLQLLVIDGALRVALHMDSLSRFFMLLTAGIWLAALIFSFPYLRHGGHQQQFLGFYTVTLGILMGLFLAKNFVTLSLFFELMTLFTVPLVLHNGTEAARRAGVKYLGYSVFGAAMALGGFFILSQYLSTLDFAAGGALDMARVQGHEPLLLTVYFLMVLGFGCKAGLLLLQAWLTTAHPVAPAPASAVLSGIITKAGILAMIRVSYYLYNPEFLRGTWAQEALLVLALVTIFVGSMLASREQLFKKRLAYSTVSQLSYIVFGLLLLQADGFRGALLQLLFHALAKNVLFLSAGAIILKTNCTRVCELRGIGKKMPLTMWCFALASLSLIGIPPLGGFISKWYLAIGALKLPGLGTAGVVVLLLSALLTAGYLLPIVTNGFFPGEDCIVEKLPVSRAMALPLLVLTGLCVLLGLFPTPLLAWIETMVQAVF